MTEQSEDADLQTAKCRQRLKFSTDRRFNPNSKRFVEMDINSSEDENGSFENEDDDFQQLVENTNQNARTIEREKEEGETSDSDNTMDLRNVLVGKQKAN